MSYVIYIIPLVLFIGTTLYYNVKSGTYYSNKLVVGFSILDVITVYSFSMAFLSRIITPQITNIFIYLSIFSVTLLIQITLFEKMVGGTADAIKTLFKSYTGVTSSHIDFDYSDEKKNSKLLRIYGREFDEVKKYIDGIAYANNVSYDKKNNAPDQMIKYIARVMGWQLTSSVIENDLLKAYLNVPAPSYSGYSRGLTAAEAEIELWRRLILNSAWLFKSKGTRKAVEFLFKFIGAPEGLINLNEYIYAAKNKIDIDSFESVLLENNYDTDLISYNVDSDGFPKTIADTPTMYFQKGGLWYRETGGANAATQINQGNNPHIGPYDGGVEYINQFRSLLPDFQPTVLTTSTFTTSVVELFTNYNNGLINNYSGDTYVGIETYSGVTLDDCFLYVADIISDPHPTAELTDCGCDLPTEDLSLIIDIKRDELTEAEQFNNCSIRISGYTYVDSTNTNFYNTPYVFNWNYLTYNVDGSLNSQYYVSPFISPTCCNNIVNGASYLYDEYIINSTTGKPTLSNSGYICCKAPTINPTPIDSPTAKTELNGVVESALIFKLKFVVVLLLYTEIACVTTSKLVVLVGAPLTTFTNSFVVLIVLFTKVWLPVRVAKLLYSVGRIVSLVTKVVIIFLYFLYDYIVSQKVKTEYRIKRVRFLWLFDCMKLFVQQGQRRTLPIGPH